MHIGLSEGHREPLQMPERNWPTVQMDAKLHGAHCTFDCGVAKETTYSVAEHEVTALQTACPCYQTKGKK